MSSAEGKCTLTKNTNIKQLCSFIRHLASTILPKGKDHVFEITPITLSDIQDDSCSCGFDGFSETSEAEYDYMTYVINENLQMKLDTIEQEYADKH
jgi:hypothetical protein